MVGFSLLTAYTRWGRTHFPDLAPLVYAGYVAGPHYSHSAGASNRLRLHQSPKHARYAEYA